MTVGDPHSPQPTTKHVPLDRKIAVCVLKCQIMTSHTFKQCSLAFGASCDAETGNNNTRKQNENTTATKARSDEANTKRQHAGALPLANTIIT